jgi:acyl carrier protein
MSELETILREIRPEFDFAASEDFIADGMLDSLDVLTLVSTLDSRYAIAIDGADIAPGNFRNLAAIEELIQTYRRRLESPAAP